MKNWKLLTLSSLVLPLMTGCATSVIPTSYLEHSSAGPARGMSLCWADPSAKLSSFDNILVEEFVTQSAVGMTPAITPTMLSSQLRDLIIAELKTHGKKAVRNKLDLPSGAPYLVIKGNFAQINPGNRAVRYMVGFGAGRTLVDVEAKVTQAEKDTTKLVAEFGASATKSMGVWGGSSDKFLDDCLVRISRLISQYVLNN